MARRIAPRDEAEDVAQQALLRAWRMRHTCRGRDPGPWLRQIARNEALRAVARRRAEPGPVAPSTGARAAADAELERTPDRLDLAAALERLSPLDRRIVALRYGADLTQAQIAAYLGMPLGTVKVRLHRARRALAKGLIRDDS